MKTTVKKLDESKILLTIEVPAVDVEQLLNQAARTVGSKLNIPGFRKGAAPRSVVEAKAGKEAVAVEVLDGEGLPSIYSRAIAEIDYEPIAAPAIEIISPPVSGKPFIFEATVEVKPEVDLADCMKCKIQRDKPAVTDAEVDTEIKNLQDRFAEIKDTLKDKAEKGLFALIDFDGSVEGKQLEGGQAEDYLLELGSDTFWPGFEAKLIGMKPGDEKTVDLVIPDNYFEKKLAGKKASFKVKLKELKSKVAPPLDDEFAKKVGFETFEGFRKDVRQNIMTMKQSQLEQDHAGRVIQAVSDAAKVEAPKTMIDDYTDRMLSNFVRQLQQVNATLADYLASQDIKLEDFRNTVAADAAKAAKSDLVLETIAKKQGINANDDELDQAVNIYIEKMGEEGNYFTTGSDALANRARLRTAIKADLIRAKTVDYVVTEIDKNSAAKKSASKEAKVVGETKVPKKAAKKPAAKTPAAKKKEKEAK